ncbi:MAG: helix-turn-helix transcriptional regulator [Coprobacillus cateniformis]|uniref:helix-turn-helix domain-containing protein n=1 Tax=Longibaculum muris TaxID=1796628 RepID=UPI003AB33047|nr:helix-turn-helix transcriptional regulator [Coprobacillus cateniformis]
MDNKKIGKYIELKRKQKGMTQQNLADSLAVTNKAVSKWETGTGLPDISLLKELSRVLGVTTDEILEGEDSLSTIHKESEHYYFFLINQQVYKQYYQAKLYEHKVLLGLLLVIGFLFIALLYRKYKYYRICYDIFRGNMYYITNDMEKIQNTFKSR